MNILIIGTGWYGCHLANYLLSKKYNITIVDKTNDFFCGSSLKNQNRLHQGFHYPRSNDTINECKIGFEEFNKVYSFLTNNIKNNYYFISLNNSLTNYNTFINKYIEHNIFFSINNINDIPFKINNVNNNIIKVNESYINFYKAKDYFKDKLNKYLVKIYNTQSINSIVNELETRYDLILNCTFNHLEPIEFDHYELYITLLYNINIDDVFAYTIMDGDFYSIYPYDIDNKIYTVTSVKYGVLYSGKSIHYQPSDKDIEERINIIDNYIQSNIPEWKTISTYKSYYLSWKTKPCTTTDDRSLRFKQKDNVLHFYGGKITGIFEAEKILESVINKIN